MPSNRNENRRTIRRFAVSGIAFLALLAGCTRVEPRPDFQRAASLVSERTGVEDVYDPQADAQVDASVAELLADGLTVDEAVRVALLNHRGFQALFAELGASRADVVQSTLLTNPSLSLGFQFPEGGGRSKLTLGLAQQLVDLWQIPVRKRIAEAELEQTLLNIAHRAVELAAQVKERCYQLLALQRSEESLRQSRALAERSLRLAQAQVEAGEVSQFDLNLTRAALIDVDLELLALERERRVAEVELARTLGLTRESIPWTLEDSLPEPVPELPDDLGLVMLALRQRLDAQAAARKVQAAEDEVARQYLAIFPDVTLGVDFERPDNRALPGRKILADTARSSIAAGQLTAPTIQSRGERNLEKQQVIDALLGPSLTVTLPVWDQNQAQIAKARYRAIQRRKEFEDLLDDVAAEVQKAAAAARNAEALVRTYEQQALPQALATLEGATRIYQSGEQSVLILIQAEQSLFRRRIDHVRALRDYAVALAELERALGGRRLATPTTQPTLTQPGPE
ncbi:MAG: TolC family protein [Planctomycetota bacterium]